MSGLRTHYLDVRTVFMPPKLAVVGSGPAGFYSLLRILKHFPSAQIDMFEKAAVPFGLTRVGVAPDHPEVKNCQDRFAEVAAAPGFRWWGNCEVGKHVKLSSLASNYHAVLLAYGAESARRLDIAGEDSLHGIYSARDFVGWYNGAPEAQSLDIGPMLASAPRATVIGNGNVALDVARILLGGVDRLRHTDITDQALDALSRSAVRHVDIVGRRGVVQSAFTNKELRELQGLQGVTMLQPEPSIDTDTTGLNRQEKRKLSLLARTDSAGAMDNTWQLQFFRSPHQFLGSNSNSQLEAIDWTVNEPDPSDPTRAIPTSQHITTETDMAIESIGYRSVPLPGMTELGIVFDPKLGTVANLRGLATPSYPVYVVGWLKTGPVGVIATTMMDAFSVGEEIVSKLQRHQLDPVAGRDALGELSSHRVVSWDDWLRIDAEEKFRGSATGKDRQKFTSTQQVLEFLDA